MSRPGSFSEPRSGRPPLSLARSKKNSEVKMRSSEGEAMSRSLQRRDAGVQERRAPAPDFIQAAPDRVRHLVGMADFGAVAAGGFDDLRKIDVGREARLIFARRVRLALRVH